MGKIILEGIINVLGFIFALPALTAIGMALLCRLMAFDYADYKCMRFAEEYVNWIESKIKN